MTNTHSNTNNPHNEGGQNPFLDFLQTLDPGHGPRRGDDNPSFGPGTGFPLNGEAFGPWGGWGGPWTGAPWARTGSPWGQPRRGRHDHDSDRGENTERHGGAEEEGSPTTLRESPDNPPASHPTPDMPHPPHRPHGPPPFPHPPFGGPGAHRRGRGRGNGGHCGRGGPRERHGAVPPSPLGGPFDFQSLLNTVSTHPLAQSLRDYVEQARSAAQGGDTNEQHGKQDDNLVPPLDIFNTEKEYVLHLALPGAMKEDVGVHWDADKGLLNVAGVVYRPGGEEFLRSLTSTCERRVGMFERSIKLPPAGADDKDEVDAYNITAKMENGILIVTVPKAEKEWTEIHKIDVE